MIIFINLPISKTEKPKEVAKPKEPEPVKKAPEPVKKAPEPVKKAPEPVKKAPEPVKKAPEPVKKAPEPKKPSPEPVRKEEPKVEVKVEAPKKTESPPPAASGWFLLI